MKARIDTGRFGIRVFFLLIVQTVCLAALPSGTAAVQQITGTVICTECSDASSSDEAEQSVILQMKRNWLSQHSASSEAAVLCRTYTLPVRRTPVLNQVRNNN